MYEVTRGGPKSTTLNILVSPPLTLFAKKAFQKYIFTVKVKT